MQEIMFLNHTIDIIVVVIVGVLLILIALYLFFTYRNNPCGGCYNAMKCKAAKKMSKALLKITKNVIILKITIISQNNK